jgi:tungstate transport system permease protein
MSYLWDQLRAAWPLVIHGRAADWAVAWTTIKVAAVSTAVALVLGLPAGVALGIGRFRGRRALHVLANVSLGLPPVLVGVGLLLFLLPTSLLGGLRIEFTLTAVYVAQAILALPYIVALTPAAIRGLPPGLLDQARAFGASRLQLAGLALREARVGVTAAVIAALASTMTEVAAVIIVGSNIAGRDQTLASAIVADVGGLDDIPDAVATAIILLLLIAILVGVLTVLQQRAGGIRLRFREA